MTITLVVALAFDAVPAPAALALATLVPAALIDLRERRLPDTWVGGAAIVFLAATMLDWIVGTNPRVGSMLLGALVLAGPILALHLLSPASMGFGDAKIAVVIGAAAGSIDWRLAIVALTLAAGTAGAVGIAARLRTVPFGTFLVLGAWAAVLGPEWWLAPLRDSRVGR